MSIPTLDLKHFTEGTAEQKLAFVQALHSTYRTIGFVAIKNHYLSEALTQQLYQAVEAFFALPEEKKAQYDIPGLHGQRGYTGKGKEHAKGSAVGDLKEFYHVGQTVQGDDPIASDYPENIFPEEIPGFAPAALEAYRQLERTGQAMLRAIALGLELEEDYFDSRIHNGNSILRAIHYFPIEEPENVPPDAVRAAQHEDINLITLLMGASAEGLQVLNREGQWVAITAVPECLVVNVGDMLQRLTNNLLRSTTHRVVNPPPEKMRTSRYSIPFFLHPRSDMDLTCLPQTVTGQQAAYEPITAGAYLDERLREIGLKA